MIDKYDKIKKMKKLIVFDLVGCTKATIAIR